MSAQDKYSLQERGRFKAWWDAARPFEGSAFPYEIAWAAWQAALSAQPSPGGQGDRPLRVFSAGVWTYDGTGQSFSHEDMDAAAFVVYRDAALAARQPVGEPVRVSGDMVDGELSVASAIDQVVELFPSADRAALRTLAACFTHHSIYRYTAPPAQAVDLGQLRAKVESLTRRVEPIGGQRLSYVQLDDVLALIDSQA